VDLFNGFGLAIRRTFFNEAPKVKPIQVSGQTIGVVTGTIGAVDPEGDKLSYTLKKAPTYGTVVLGPGGTYTYTPGAGFDGTDEFTVSAMDVGFHINLLNWFRPSSTQAVAHVERNFTPPPHCTTTCVTFKFTYGTGADWWTPESRAALQAAADTLSDYLVVTSAVTITYNVSAGATPDGASSGASALANALSSYFNEGVTFNDTVVGHKIQTGVDLNGQAADGTIWFKSTASWSFGGEVASDQYDFESVAIHELVHTLGFLSSIESDNPPNGVKRTVLDSFLITIKGEHPISTDGAWNRTYNPYLTGQGWVWNDSLGIDEGGLYFGGANAVAAYGGSVPLNTPDEFAPGNSMSHLGNPSQGGLGSFLMGAGAPRGLTMSLNPFELAILKDLGYTILPGYAEIVV